jgi:ribosomal protein L18
LVWVLPRLTVVTTQPSVIVQYAFTTERTDVVAADAGAADPANATRQPTTTLRMLVKSAAYRASARRALGRLPTARTN